MTAARKPWVCSCGHKNFGAACYGGCGKEKPPAAATEPSFREQLIAATMKASGCTRTEDIVILDLVHDRLGGATHDEAVAANPMPSEHSDPHGPRHQ